MGAFPALQSRPRACDRRCAVLPGRRRSVGRRQGEDRGRVVRKRADRRRPVFQFCAVRSESFLPARSVHVLSRAGDRSHAPGWHVGREGDHRRCILGVDRFGDARHGSRRSAFERVWSRRCASTCASHCARIFRTRSPRTARPTWHSLPNRLSTSGGTERTRLPMCRRFRERCMKRSDCSTSVPHTVATTRAERPAVAKPDPPGTPSRARRARSRSARPLRGRRGTRASVGIPRQAPRSHADLSSSPRWRAAASVNSASLVGHASNRPVLIVIPFGINIGFAIHRLIGVFYEMAVRLTGDPTRVHFAFTKVRDGRSPALPPDFDRFVEFDSVNPTPADVERLAAYVRASGIATVFALDLHAEAPFLPAVRQAGVGRVISYSARRMSSINRGPKLALKPLEVALLRPSKPESVHFRIESDAGPGGPWPRSRSCIDDDRPYRRRSAGVSACGGSTRRCVFAIRHSKRPPNRRVHGPSRRTQRRSCADASRPTRRARYGPGGRSFLVSRPGRGPIGAIPRSRGGGERARHLRWIPRRRPRAPGWLLSRLHSVERMGLVPHVVAGNAGVGLPVVVSDLQGVPETIENGATGIVVPAGDSIRLGTAITDLVDDPARRDAMGQAARRRIETQLTRDHQIENLVRVVGSLGI